MLQSIDELNCDFYNCFKNRFDKIPFITILPDLIKKYASGRKVLEIGSGSGALAVWLATYGYEMTCLEPAQELARKSQAKGIKTHCLSIQNFVKEDPFDMILAISSLIHIAKSDVPIQIEKIDRILKPKGTFFVSLLEGESEGFEDPTNVGKLHYFSHWKEHELELLFSPYFVLLEAHTTYSKKMDRTFFLRVYRKN